MIKMIMNHAFVCSTLHQAALTIGPEALQASSENFFLSSLFLALAVDVDMIQKKVITVCIRMSM